MVLFVTANARLFPQAPLPVAVKVIPGPVDVAVVSAFVAETPAEAETRTKYMFTPPSSKNVFVEYHEYEPVTWAPNLVSKSSSEVTCVATVLVPRSEVPRRKNVAAGAVPVLIAPVRTAVVIVTPAI